jgi:hypothetical protein
VPSVGWVSYDDIPSAFARDHGRAAIFGLYVMHCLNEIKNSKGGIGGSTGVVPTVNSLGTCKVDFCIPNAMLFYINWFDMMIGT